MVYYGLVDKLRDEHKSGLYGRIPAKNNGFLNGVRIGLLSSGTGLFPYIEKSLKETFAPIQLYKEKENNIVERELIIDNDLLFDFYSIKNSEKILYGLFDNFSRKQNVFQIIMKSQGGSKLIIIEREDERFKHYGGERGNFTRGLYITHPKSLNTLIPLDKSKEIIEELILNEILEAFEALGAKKIIISDTTSASISSKGRKNKVNTGVNASSQNKVLREKSFGEGTFDPNRATNNCLFIFDYPSIMGVIKARINGNQSTEYFTQEINISAGLDVEVLDVFSGGLKLNYNRKWSFNVEFYDKNRYG